MGPDRGFHFPIHRDSPPSVEGTAEARESFISPRVVSQRETTAQREFLVGATESARVLAADESLSVPGAAETPSAPEVAHSDDEEVEEGRVPRSRKFPDSMSAEELRVHSLTHIPFHP